MDYKKAWNELEYEIGRSVDLLVIKDPCNDPSSEDIAVINSLRRVERLMQWIEEKHGKEDK